MRRSTRGMLAIATVASLSAPGRGGETREGAIDVELGFTVVPPCVVTDEVDVELRAGLRNGEATSLELQVSFYADVVDEANRISTQVVSVPPGQWRLVSARWPASGQIGTHELMATVAEGRTLVAQGSWPIEVRDAGTPSLPILQAGWIDPGALVPGVYPSEGAATEDDLRSAVDSMHEIGMTTIIVTYVEYMLNGWGPFYPSSIEALGAPVVAFDVIDTILSQAEQHKMHVFLGLGRGPEALVFFPSPDPREVAAAIELGTAVATELVQLYGHYESLYGWYLTHEHNYLAGASAYYDPMCEMLDAFGPHRPVMVAPSGTPIHTTREVSQSRVDIFAYQDAVGAGYVPYVNTFDPSMRIAMLHDVFASYVDVHAGTGKHLWADLEVWQMDGPAYGNPYPAEFDRVETQIGIEHQYAQMLTAYEFLGFFEHPDSTLVLGGPAAVELYEDYAAYACAIIENDAAACTCAADLDGDGAVAVTDLLALLAAWGGPGGDLTGDATTDIADLLSMLGAWGTCT